MLSHLPTGLHWWQFRHGGIFGGAWGWYKPWRPWRLDSLACNSLLRFSVNCQVQTNQSWKYMSQSSLKTKILSRYLIEHNSDVAAVNNDGELPIDIAETEAMEELLERETQLRGITICKTFPSYNLTTVIIQQVLIVKQLECKKKDKCLPTLVGGWKETQLQLGCSSRTLAPAPLRSTSRPPKVTSVSWACSYKVEASWMYKTLTAGRHYTLRHIGANAKLVSFYARTWQTWKSATTWYDQRL